MSRCVPFPPPGYEHKYSWSPTSGAKNSESRKDKKKKKKKRKRHDGQGQDNVQTPGQDSAPVRTPSLGTDSPSTLRDSSRANGSLPRGGPISPSLSLDHPTTSKPSTPGSSSLSLTASASKVMLDVSSPRREENAAADNPKERREGVVVRRAEVADETAYMVEGATEDWEAKNRRVKRLTRSCDWLRKPSKGAGKRAGPLSVKVWSEAVKHPREDLLILPFVGVIP